MSDLRFAGMGYPNGAVKNTAVFGLPSPDLLMLSTEGRYHHSEAMQAGKRVAWRAIPRIGKRPAELGWSPSRFATEALNLTDETQVAITDFIPWNELDLRDERGDSADDYSGLAQRYALIGGWAFSVLETLSQQMPGTRLHWPAFTPDHQALDYRDAWQRAADRCQVIDFHAYDTLDKIAGQYEAYRAAFPGKPLALTEWHGKGDLNEERRILAWLAETMQSDPLFDAAYFFIWRWWDHPGWWSDDWDIEHSPARLALFSNPPLAAVEPSKPDKPHPDEPEAPMSPDPWEFWSAERIADVAKCPLDAVRENHPRLVAQLALVGLNTRAVQAAVIGTTAIETASTYAPVKEAFWLGDDYRAALRYAPYWGRGFIQLTWEQNYRTYGAAVDALWQAGGAIDLIARPGDALDPDVSAAVFACYIRDHGGDGQGLIAQAAERGDWREVRRLVQGADAGLDRLITITSALLSGAPAATADLVYAPDVPDAVTAQENDWSCAVRSTYAALYMAAEHGLIDPVTYGDDGPRDVYAWLVPTYDDSAVGLHDHTGAGIVAALASHGIAAGNAYPVSLADVQARAGKQPLMIGGDAYGHWVAVRGLESDGTLILENPARGYKGINDELRDSFDKLGPFGMVWIDGSAAPSQPAQPSTVAALLDRLEVARAGLDDYGELPPDPGPKASKADLWAYVRNLQAWRDTIRANTDRSYQEIGAIGAALRTAQ